MIRVPERAAGPLRKAENNSEKKIPPKSFYLFLGKESQNLTIKKSSLNFMHLECFRKKVRI